ncbi:MAG: hypothetical protein AVDCRST_MAG71-388, partial [uncultured Lysobacter sp.]
VGWQPAIDQHQLQVVEGAGQRPGARRVRADLRRLGCGRHPGQRGQALHGRCRPPARPDRQHVHVRRPPAAHGGGRAEQVAIRQEAGSEDRRGEERARSVAAAVGAAGKQRGDGHGGHHSLGKLLCRGCAEPPGAGQGRIGQAAALLRGRGLGPGGPRRVAGGVDGVRGAGRGAGEEPGARQPWGTL